MSKQKIQIFTSIKQEAEFWDTHHITDYLDELNIIKGDYQPIPGKVKNSDDNLEVFFMSKWQQYELENKITQILATVPDSADEHHLGRAYLTAYQIAIEFASRYPDDFSALGLPVGGAGTGQRNSLAQYFAQQLSRRINSGHIKHIEGGFLSNLHLNDISFIVDDGLVHSSLTGSGFTLSMYRLID